MSRNYIAQINENMPASEKISPRATRLGQTRISAYVIFRLQQVAKIKNRIIMAAWCSDNAPVGW